jgi:hypothetical protein
MPDTDLPEPIKTNAGETIEITCSDFDVYTVECWDASDSSRWHRSFHDKAKALEEFNRWQHLAIKD